MSEQPLPMQQTMPEEDGGWHRINAGPHLHIMFNPNRLGRQPDEIERPSILVAVAGKREQPSPALMLQALCPRAASRKGPVAPACDASSSMPPSGTVSP